MSASLRRTGRMTVDEFLDWGAGADGRWQLVDGEPRAMAPAGLNHGYLQAELASLIRNHLRARGSKCDVFINSGVIPATMAAINMRIPDLMVSCTPFAPGQVAAKEPVLLIELLSPGNRPDTMANVWAYTSIASVLEIVVIRSDAIAAEMLRRLPDGSWPDRLMSIKDGDLLFESIDLRLPLDAIYERTMLRRT